MYVVYTIPSWVCLDHTGCLNHSQMLGEPQCRDKYWCPVTAEGELRHTRTQPLARVAVRAGFQVQRRKLGKIFRGFELWKTKVQGPCPALHVICFFHLIYPPFVQTESSLGQEKFLLTNLHSAQDNGFFPLSNSHLYSFLPNLNAISEWKKMYP